MSLVYVDGYNMLHGCAVFKERCSVDLESARALLIDRLARHGDASRDHIVLVFDGTTEFANVPGSAVDKNLDIVFTRGGMSADSYIQRVLSKSKGQNDDCIVVSADGAVISAASSMGAIAIGPEMFLRHMDHAVREQRQGVDRPDRQPHHVRVEDVITRDEEQHLKHMKDNIDRNDTGVAD
ncbi:MAG: NYN domain-containing protein, partial [Candidatus Hydrogenedentes bacterium]|nr:NYN domain-containing protein [Candidatus Hydrogenedentota bacterium]